MNPHARGMDLSARTILIWFALLLGLLGSTVLSWADLVLGGSGLLALIIWVIRIVVLAMLWLLPASRARKAWGTGLLLGVLVLDVLLKLPVLGTVEYGDWFLVSALDLTGQFSSYFIICGMLLPLLLLGGWFILRQRRAIGWAVGLLAAAGMGWATYAVAASETGTLVLFVLLSGARFILPAWLAVGADYFWARRKLSTKN